MIKLLLVEDDTNLSYMIKNGLELTIGGYEVVTANNGKEGIRLWKDHRPEVILADVEMPEMNGFEMIEHIRDRDPEVTILFISGCDSPFYVTKGYKLGANNYIKKPFNPEELDAHIQAILKVKNDIRLRNESNLKTFGSFVLDPDHGVLKFESSKVISLTSRESLILHELCLNKGEIVRRDFLLEKYWNIEGGQDYFASRSLDVMLTKLRKKLTDDPNVKIKVSKGIGVYLIDNSIKE